jgi:hypothetical protein
MDMHMYNEHEHEHEHVHVKWRNSYYLNLSIIQNLRWRLCNGCFKMKFVLVAIA